MNNQVLSSVIWFVGPGLRRVSDGSMHFCCTW